jgi:hypothetical protein
MTVGALIQLQYGNVDRMAFLTLNPQLTHFKSVYKKHTNFSIEYITNLPLSANSPTLSWDTDATISFKVPRDGDAIRDIYFTFELPDIYSNSNYQFQWIKRIGEYIVKDVSIQIDSGQSIDKHYSEYLHAYSELNYDEGKKKGYYKMIGNVVEMYDPANAAGNGGIYPSTAYAPSIIGRKVYLPLAFWFNKWSSMCFPLIAIQKSVVYINFTLRRLRELYTVVDFGGSGYRVKPATSNHYIGKFLANSTPSINSLDINPQLEINNIYLDDEERKRFALSSHEYLITQVQYLRDTYNTSINTIIDLKNINKPVKELIFMIRRSDMEDVNDWTNYTNWNVDSVPPYSVGYVNPVGSPLTINMNTIGYYKTSNLLKSATLRIEGNRITDGYVLNNDSTTSARLEGKDSVFYNLVQNFNSNSNVPSSEGIYTYSFSLDNSSLQPIGSVNMSSIANKDILMNLTAINPNGGYNGAQYNYTIYTFAVNYDVLKVMGGMVGTMTVN